MYKDGVLVDSGTTGTGAQDAIVSNVTKIGYGVIGSSEYFDGHIDDVRIYDRALSAAEVKRLYDLGNTTRVAETVTSNTTLEDDLVGHWTFDGPDMDWGSTTAEVKDRSGQGNSGDAASSMSVSKSPEIGIIGQGIQFNGTDDWVDITSGTVFDAGTQTWALWYKTDGVWGTDGTSAEDVAILIGRHDAVNSRNGVYIILHPEGLLNVSNKPNSGFSSNLDAGTTTLKEWHHVAYVFRQGNGENNEVYVDGVVATSSVNSAAWSFNNQDIMIGDSADSWWEEYGGQIDDVRIYDRALSAAEVKRLYELGQ